MINDKGAAVTAAQALGLQDFSVYQLTFII